MTFSLAETWRLNKLGFLVTGNPDREGWRCCELPREGDGDDI